MSQREQQPLLDDGHSTGEVGGTWEANPIQLVSKNNFASPWAVIAQVGLLAWLVIVWTIVLRKPEGLFTFHPLFQSTAVVLFSQGIMALQPTRTPVAKRTGLSVHRVLQILGATSILAGASVVLAVKVKYNAPHFTTWHGKFGLISVILVLGQVLVGSLVGFESGRRLIGGDARAKGLWKYHRAGGYTLFASFTVTALTALRSSWVSHKASSLQVNIATAAFIVGIVGIAGRISLKKIF